MDEAHFLTYVCGQFSNIKIVFENLVISVGRFVPWDALSLGRFVPWDVWAVFSVHLNYLL